MRKLQGLFFAGIGFFLLFFLNACQTPGGNVVLNWPSSPPERNEAPAGEVSRHPGGGPPPHAKAHGYHRKFGYHYYPNAEVYYDEGRKVYFYLDGNEWRMEVSLPGSLRVRLGDYVEIEMDSDKPYTEFAEHKSKYPPGQLKKKHKSKGWK